MSNDQHPLMSGGEGGERAGAAGTGSGRRKRVLWLHTQPEHYFNCMMDDLAAGRGYTVGGMEAAAGGGEYEYVAAFSYRGPGWYKENAQPRVAETVFLTPAEGNAGRAPGFRERYHRDWRGELMGLRFEAAIVSGYGWRTHREVIGECVRRGIPVAMWSDSNLRSQRGKGFKARMRRRLKKRWLAKLVRQCDLQLTANSLGVGYWRYFGAAREKIVVCPCYSDYGRIDAARARARGEVLGRIGLSGEDRVLFSAARLVRAKGLELMIGAFRELGLGRKGWKYVIAGMGELEGELKALAGEDLGKSIVFVGFQQPSENLALMAHAEMLVLPSRYEPHGIVVAEALAAGTPVLASDVVGAARDLVVPGKSGLMFRSEDGRDLAEKLGMVMEEGKLGAMRAGARGVFEAWYRRTTPMRVVPAVVGRLLAGRERAAAGSRGGGR